VQNQDSREHDLLDSDEYYQFEGGMAAALRSISPAAQPVIYHNDLSRPEKPGGAHAGRRDRPRRARPRRQSEMDRRRQAPWLQGRLRDRRDGRLHVRLRRHDGRGEGPSFRGSPTRPMCEDERVCDFILEPRTRFGARRNGAAFCRSDRPAASGTPRSNSARYRPDDSTYSVSSLRKASKTNPCFRREEPEREP
jgi:hypothetical protein